MSGDDVPAALRDAMSGPRATRHEIASAERALDLELPADYVQAMLEVGAGEGFLGEDGDYLVLWPVAELEEYNADYEVAE